LNYIYLIVAVAFEVVATSALKETNGFTRLWPSVIALAGYACAFYFLSLVLRQVPVGIVYAMWCGAGIVFITAIAWIWFRQALDLPARHRTDHGRSHRDQPVFEVDRALNVSRAGTARVPQGIRRSARPPGIRVRDIRPLHGEGRGGRCSGLTAS